MYLEALAALRRGGVEFLIGGAHALAPYTGIVRDTKDLDVFLRKEDCDSALAVLARRASRPSSRSRTGWGRRMPGIASSI